MNMSAPGDSAKLETIRHTQHTDGTKLSISGWDQTHNYSAYY